MKPLRSLILLLAFLMVLLLGVERLRMPTTANPFDFVWLLALLGLLAIITLGRSPLLSRAPAAVPVALAVAIYLLCRYLALGDGRRITLTGGDMAVGLLEIATLSALVLVARDLASRLVDVEQVFVDLTSGGEDRKPKPLEDAADEIEVELRRSLRYHRPLSVIVVEPEPSSLHASVPRILDEALTTLSSRYALSKLGSTIGEVVRGSDTVLSAEGGRRFIVLCPETDCSSAGALIHRIESAAGDRLGVTVTCGEAMLPAYQITFDDLVAQAQGTMRGAALPAREKTPVA